MGNLRKAATAESNDSLFLSDASETKMESSFLKTKNNNNNNDDDDNDDNDNEHNNNNHNNNNNNNNNDNDTTNNNDNENNPNNQQTWTKVFPRPSHRRGGRRRGDAPH